MKNNQQKTKFLPLLLFIIFISSCATPQPINTEVSQVAISNYEAAQKNPNLSDEDKIKIAIEAYFTLRYESQKQLVQQDFSILLADSSLDWVQKEIDKREIELYIACMFEISYQSYDFQLDYSTLEIENDIAEVSLEESHQVVFTIFAPDISGMSGLVHHIILHKKNEIWVIYQDEYTDENTNMFASRTKEQVKNQVDSNYVATGEGSLENPEAEKCQHIVH